MRKGSISNKTKEVVIQKHILDYLRFRGVKAGKTKTMGVFRHGKYSLDPMTYIGFPDITSFWKLNATEYALVFIEVKSYSGILRNEQKEFQEYVKAVNSSHVHYIVARSVEDIIRFADMILGAHSVR
jgi:hypothetical protein